MIAIVCGGRDYTDEARIFEALDELHASSPFTLIKHGAARGSVAMTCAEKQAAYQQSRHAWAAEIGRPIQMAGRSVLTPSRDDVVSPHEPPPATD